MLHENRPLLILLHIPKCAGTSVAAAVAEHFGPENCYFYGKNEPYKRYDKSAPELGKFKFVKGHLTLDQINMIKGPKKIFTIMREPVDRVLSWYEFIVRHERTTLHPFAAKGDPHAFIQKCLDARNDPAARPPILKNIVELTNGMAHRLSSSATAERALEVLDHHDIKVINQGNLGSEIDALWDWLDLPHLPLPQLNTAPEKKSYPASVTERIKELNEQDMQLFETLFPAF
tara:strand:+ start:969 stop:1661 length:693 start_codon:yes stop_codon:yes gene_type:complete